MAGFDEGAYLPRVLLARPADAPRHWSQDGTMAFIDISGFTKLSEQLAARGREGAEDLVSTLVRIFTLLLAATDDGGDVIKFGGDALAIAYTGPDHALRACHSAFMMQKMIRVVGQVELTGARTRLRMSIGVSTGTLEFLLPEGEQEDLVVTGPTVTRMLALESLAAPGQILLSAATAAALAPGTTRAVDDDTFELVRMAALPSRGSQILFRHHDEEQARRHLPRVFQERPELLASGSDHRRAAMAFVQVSGLDDLVTSDPGEALRRTTLVASSVRDAVDEAGVTVLDTDVAPDGFKYFLAAGAPLALEDAEGRMLRALLRIVATDCGLGLRAGSASGPVFAGTVGAPFRCAYAAMGDTTNLAARLCAKAPHGAVLAQGSMLRRSLTEFVHDQPQYVQLKGKVDPVAVVRVEAAGQRRGRGTEALPFIGREQELADIATELAGTRRGHGGIVEIVGEPGLGKSRLAAQALDALGLPVHRLQADPYGEQVPYRAVRDLLRPLLGIPADMSDAEAGGRLTEVVSEVAPALLPTLPLVAVAVGASVASTPTVEGLDPRFRMARLHDAVAELLAVLLTDPIALCFEDAHWIDETSAEVLSAALANARERPWAVVLTRWHAAGGLAASAELPMRTVDLDTFDAETAASLVLERNRELHPEKVAAIVARADGNPYFLLELATSHQVGDGRLPDTVEELVGSLIDQLEVDDRDLLRHASVLGSRFTPELFATATGEHDVETRAQSAGLQPFLERAPDGTIAFRREIYREVSYAQLRFRSRRQLHLAVARAIEDVPALAGEDRLPLLSLHYSEAGVWDRAHEVSWQAGDRAREDAAHDAAADFYRRALAAGARIGIDRDTVGRLHELVGDSAQHAGEYDEGASAYAAALRVADDPRDRVRLLLQAARCHDQQASFARSRRLYRRARAEAADPLVVGTSPVLLAELDVGEAASRYYQGKLEPARKLAETAWVRATQLSETAEDRDRIRRVRARAAFMYDSAAGLLHGPEGLRFRDLPLRMYLQLGDDYFAGIVSNNLGLQAFNEGRWTDAAALYGQARELSERAGDRTGAAFAAMNLAEILGHQGLVPRAEQLLRQSLATFTGMKLGVGRAAACTLLADLLLRCGDVEAAAALVAEAREVCESIGAEHDLSEVEVVEIDLLRAHGRLVEAVESAEALLARHPAPAPLHVARLRRVAGTILTNLGEHERAGQHLGEALRIAREMRSTFEIAHALELLAGLGHPDGDAAQADVLLRELGIRRGEIRTLA